MNSSKKLAHDNGKLCERFVLDNIKDFEFIYDPVDGKLGNVFAEIKSCMMVTKRGEKYRSGRFWLRSDQHDFLVENNGLYIFLVTDGESVLYSRMVKASCLKKSVDGAVTITWWKLFNNLIGNHVSKPQLDNSVCC